MEATKKGNGILGQQQNGGHKICGLEAAYTAKNKSFIPETTNNQNTSYENSCWRKIFSF